MARERHMTGGLARETEAGDSSFMSDSFSRSNREGRNLTSSITQDLGRAIVTGRFKDVMFPYEADLCKQYGVSRPVLREAVKMIPDAELVTYPRLGHGLLPVLDEPSSPPRGPDWCSESRPRTNRPSRCRSS